MDNVINSHPVLWVLSTLVVGFVAGFGAYRAILGVGSLETVRKGSYVLKSDIVGRLLRAESLRELGHLIELGEKMDTSATKDAETYMLRVHTFVHYLDLEKDAEYGNRSFAEESIDHIIRDIPNTGTGPRPIPEKIARIVGALKGLQSSLVSRAGE
jgi:hypothetical protein